MSDTGNIDRRRIASSGIGRLFEGQTSIDFVGRRKIGVVISALLIVATVVSLLAQGLNLGIDFEGGVSWDVPSSNGFTVDDAEQVLTDNGLSSEGARLQERSSESGDIVKVQVGDQPEEVGTQLRGAFAEAAGVSIDEVNVNLVSSSWGSEITNKALRALVIFLIIVAIFISLRFEWRMALAAIAAMVHDVLISVGIYSIFQFIVTPPTVIAFLTILGYSLYDTIVVFDRVKENEARFATQKPPYDDVINVSMNQVLMRSLNTSFSSIVPVVSLLLIGSGVLGQATLAEFALALLIGMVTGAYSSIFVAAPLLAVLKTLDAAWDDPSVVVVSVPGSGFDTSRAAANFAPFRDRVVGAVVDGLVVMGPTLLGIIVLAFGVILESVFVVSVGVLFTLGMLTWLVVSYCQRVATTGQSWGGTAVDAYIVDAETGKKISATRAFWRAAARSVSIAVFYLGFLWTLWDPRKQTWHDKLARTVVVQLSPAQREAKARQATPRAVGDELRTMVLGAAFSSKRARQRNAGSDAEPADGPLNASTESSGSTLVRPEVDAATALKHPPRPRKKKRR